MLERSAADSFEDTLKERYSCRSFLSTQVPKATIHRILTMAQRTASWNNTQPWEVIITSGEATEKFRTELFEFASAKNPGQPDIDWPREYKGIYQARRRECGFGLYAAAGIQRGDREASMRQGMENFRLFAAPHVAIISSDEPIGPYGAVDCGAYVSNFMLAAHTLGVATVAQAAVTQHGRFVHQHFGIADNRLLVCGISFGFADPEHPLNKFRTTRADIGEIAKFVE